MLPARILLGQSFKAVARKSGICCRGLIITRKHSGTVRHNDCVFGKENEVW